MASLCSLATADSCGKHFSSAAVSCTQTERAVSGSSGSPHLLYGQQREDWAEGGWRSMKVERQSWQKLCPHMPVTGRYMNRPHSEQLMSGDR